MRLSRDFRDFVACCIAHEVRFLVVGGYALGAHGFPRYTADFDVWIWLDRGNAQRVVDAVSEFGYASSGLTPDDVLDPGAVITMGREPRRIDVLASISGVEFGDCWPNRVEMTVGSMKIPFIGKEDFVRNKRASGRLQDLADVARLLGEE